MSYLQPPPPDGQAVQFQLSLMGGSNMLEATPNDASLRRFEIDADSTFGTATQSNHGSSPHVYHSLLATAQDSFSISDGQSPQLSQGVLFTSDLARAGSSSDWLQQRTSVANGPSLIFSSPSQYNPGPNHYPHTAAQTQMTRYDAHQEPYEGGDGNRQHGPFNTEDQMSTELYGNRFPNTSVTQPYNSLGQPQAHAFSQPDSGTLSRHSSNDGTPTATCSDVKDMVPNIFNSTNERLFSIGSSGFQLPNNDMQPFPDVETTNSYHSPETDCSSVILPFPEPTNNRLQVSNIGAPRSRRSTTSHYGTLENATQRLSLRRSSSTRLSNSRSPIAQAHLQPRPQNNVSEGTENGSFVKGEYPLLRKGRGKRTGPLGEGKRKDATRRRNERTVCIGCKLAKVTCQGREHGSDCIRCISGHNNAPKPFVCVPASFIELIQRSSTMLLAFHTIHLRSSDGFLQAISLPNDIDIKQLLGSINLLKRSYGVVRAFEGGNMLFELDLQSCYAFITNYPPTSHNFRQLIDGLKFKRLGYWEACIKNSTLPPENLCDMLFAWDDAALQVTYSSANEISQETEDRLDLDPNQEQHKQIIFAVSQLYRIIGRQLELHFYDHLKRALARPNICHEVVLEVGRAIISLRRRLVSWGQPWDNVPFPSEIDMYTEEDNDNGYGSREGSIVADRVKRVCLILYVYFCYMRRRLSVEEQIHLQTMEVRDPVTGRMVKEDLPQYESIKGFEDWLQFTIN